MTTKTIVRSAAVLAAVAGAAFVVVEIRPFGAQAEDPIYGDGYQQHIGRQRIPVAVTRYEFRHNHPDFTLTPDDGAGRYVKIMAPELDADRKPVYESTGSKVITPWTDESGDHIAPPNPYLDAQPGDQSGQLSVDRGGAVTSPGTFDQWFNAERNVNQWSTSTMHFEQQPSGTYVLEGSLADTSDSPAHTAELGWGFVYEAERDNFLEIETGAEAWVFIDGKLVIDGGGLGELIEFEIVDGVVIPGEPFEASIHVPGAAIQSNDYHYPVTMRAHIGSDQIDPFGSYDDAVFGNLNDNQDVTGHANPGANPRFYSEDTVYPGGTPITVEGRSWRKVNSGDPGTDPDNWKVNRSGNTLDDTPQIKVLRNGDPVPNIKGAYDQGDVASFLTDYIDYNDNTVLLASNQIIYLMELGVDATGGNGDFQDLVAVVTLSAPGASNSGLKNNDGTNAALAPRLTQSIDLSRLDWLEDKHPYRIQVFYANRTGSQSDLRIETNLRTLNVLNPPAYDGKD